MTCLLQLVVLQAGEGNVKGVAVVDCWHGIHIVSLKQYVMPILQQVNNDDLKHPGDDPNVTDPQENEKDGNVFGKVFDAVFGNFEGKHTVGADEPDEHPDNTDSNTQTRPLSDIEREAIEDEENGGSM